MARAFQVGRLSTVYLFVPFEFWASCIYYLLKEIQIKFKIEEIKYTFLEMKTKTKRLSGLCVFCEGMGCTCRSPQHPVPSIVHAWALCHQWAELKETSHSHSSIGRTPRLFCGVSAKNTYPESNHEETSDKLKLRSILKNKWPVHFTNVKVMADQERAGNRLGLKETEGQDSWACCVQYRIASQARRKNVVFFLKDIH